MNAITAPSFPHDDANHEAALIRGEGYQSRLIKQEGPPAVVQNTGGPLERPARSDRHRRRVVRVLDIMSVSFLQQVRHRALRNGRIGRRLRLPAATDGFLHHGFHFVDVRPESIALGMTDVMLCEQAGSPIAEIEDVSVAAYPLF